MRCVTSAPIRRLAVVLFAAVLACVSLSARLASAAPLSITPTSVTLAPGQTQQFLGMGGNPPYVWTLSANGSGPAASISLMGLYTAGAATGVDTVQLADSSGGSVTATVNVLAMVPIGATCASASVCPVTSDGNAYCVDGVCCDSACTGQCQGCNTAGAIGKCVTVSGPPVGMRPACPMSDPNDVCSSMACDGKSATSCDVFVGSSVVCGPANCVDFIGTPLAVCMGDGGCQHVSPASCGTYACVSGACATSCTNTSECSPGNYCEVDAGKCVVPDAGSGSADGGTGPHSAPTPASSGCAIGTAPRGLAPSVALAALVGLVVRRRRSSRSTTAGRTRAIPPG